MLHLVLKGTAVLCAIWLFGLSIHIGGSILYLLWLVLIMGIGYTLFIRDHAL